MKAVYPCHAPQSVHVCIFQFLQCILSCTQKVSYTLLYLASLGHIKCDLSVVSDLKTDCKPCCSPLMYGREMF